MTKQEFLDEFRTALTGQVHHSVVNENIEYYDTYISMQMRKGMSEEEVTDSLGMPRILAKTIINAEKYAGREETGTETERAAEQKREGGKGSFRSRFLEMPGWLMLIIIVLVPILCMTVLSAVFSVVFSIVGPFLLPLLLVMLIVRIARRS